MKIKLTFACNSASRYFDKSSRSSSLLSRITPELGSISWLEAVDIVGCSTAGVLVVVGSVCNNCSSDVASVMDCL